MVFVFLFLGLLFCYTCDGLANGTSSLQSHPYFVTLLSPKLCGGVLISLWPEAWVLTAAHCVYQGNGSLVTSGQVRYGKKRHQLFHKVIAHPMYKKIPYNDGPFRSIEEEEQEQTINSTLYDVALIRLDHGITTTPFSTNDSSYSYSSIYYNSMGKHFNHHHNRPPDVQAIPISTITTNNTYSTTECMGMGATSLIPGSESTKLMTANCQPANNNRTIGIFGPYLDAVQVIQFSSSAVLCHGDSGGPLIVKNNNQVSYINGILSRILYAYDPNPDQPACPVPESPDDLPMANVFVKPAYHLSWISENTALSIHNLTIPAPPSAVSPSSSYFDILHQSRAATTFSPFVGLLGLVLSLSCYLLL